MDPKREKFLNLKTPPARLNAEEAAWYLGFAPHDIPILVANGLIKPLGHPMDNTTKFFAFVTLQELRNDPKWLARAIDIMMAYWRGKNGRKSKNRKRLSPQRNTDEYVCEVPALQI